MTDRTGLAAELVSRSKALIAEAGLLGELAAELVSETNATAPEPAPA